MTLLSACRDGRDAARHSSSSLDARRAAEDIPSLMQLQRASSSEDIRTGNVSRRRRGRQGAGRKRATKRDLVFDQILRNAESQFVAAERSPIVVDLVKQYIFAMPHLLGDGQVPVQEGDVRVGL